MRITEKMLQNRVDYLNKVTDNNPRPWEHVNGNNKANIGNYHLSGAYGGWCLHQMMNESGGVNSTFNCGYLPKRELMGRIDSYILGIQN